MPQIEELRRQRAGINEQVQALATIEAGGGTLGKPTHFEARDGKY